MRLSRSLAALAISAFILSSSSTGAAAAVPPQASGSVPVCPGPASPGSARCHSHVVTSVGKAATTGPTGLTPQKIVSAYGWAGIPSGAGTAIAIVDAFDDPKAKADLDTFSTTFGLPVLPTCNASLGAGAGPTNQPCFQKVNQNGGAKYPRSDQGWALEISLDIQWAHAVAPGANILLVEASTNSFANLLAAEDYAKTHAQYVSNSWGASEFSGETVYDPHFAQPGVSFFVSAGDAGLPADYPSASPNVISVGGTRLTFNADGTLASETGWSSGGGGCSSFETATPAQSGFAGYAQVPCSGKRATPDVSLDADPASGVSVLDTFGYQGQKGWFVVGGTSASAPMWAARSAAQGIVVDSAQVYRGATITYRDITVGNNGAPCLVGYDLCSGRGSWSSIP